MRTQVFCVYVGVCLLPGYVCRVCVCVCVFVSFDKKKIALRFAFHMSKICSI